MTHSMKWNLGLAVVLLTLVGAFPLWAQVQGPGPGDSPNSKVSYTLVDTVNEVIVNQCNGENVTLSGDLTQSYRYDTRPNGDLHQVVDTRANLVGVGDVTGAKYVCKDTTHTDIRVDPAPPDQPNAITTQDYSEKDKLKLVAQGKTPDMTITYTLHWTINKQAVTTWREKPSIAKCK